MLTHHQLNPKIFSLFLFPPSLPLFPHLPQKPSLPLFIPSFVKKFFPNPPIKPPNSTFIPPHRATPLTCWQLADPLKSPIYIRPFPIPSSFTPFPKKIKKSKSPFKSLDKSPLLCYTISKQGGNYEIRRNSYWRFS